MTEESLFLAALEKPSSAERQAFLYAECGADRDLLRRVKRLLDADDRTHGILEAGREALADTQSFTPDTAALAGVVVAGRYRILDRLGEGGMGTVWLAEQTTPVRRKVALKLIKPGMDSQAVLARFENERQALALMDHPHIAKIFDGGTTAHGTRPSPISQSDAGEFLADGRQPIADGRPFFVMEYVQGLPLTKYCDDARLTVNQRLQLFVLICQAVQHAHQKGILHRDLKPSNILVAAGDGTPVPKVIDFGLAKALHQPLTEHTVHTALGMMVGTPLYMSPEQAEFNNLDIDTRADIYSLGVILYELLCGAPPFTADELRTAAFTEMLRMIKEVDPVRPSTKLSSTTDMATVAANRRLEPRQLKNLVSGELDWIVMKCLEKERGRRYATANGLATDVLRYLADEPVEAGPPSARYRLRKFLSRHRGPVLAATTVVVLLLGGIVGTTWGMVEAQTQRDDAEEARKEESEQRTRAELAERIAKADRDRALEAEADTGAFSHFLVHHVLAASRPEGVQEGLGVDVKLSYALAVAEAEIDRVFHGRPRAEAESRHALGVTWRNLGKERDAERNLRRALELQQRTLGPTHEATLKSMASLAVLLRSAGQVAEAMALSRQVLDGRLAALGPVHRSTLQARFNMAFLHNYLGKWEEAIHMLEEVHDVQQRLYATELELLKTRDALGLMYAEAGKIPEGIRLLEETHVARVKRQGPDHLETSTTVETLGKVHYLAAKNAEALRLFEKVRDIRRVKLGPEHPFTLAALNNIAAVYQSMGRRREGIKLLEEVRDAQVKARGLDHPATLLAIGNLATGFKDDGRSAEAIPLYEQVRERFAALVGPDHEDTLITEINLVGALSLSGQHERARAVGEATLPRVLKSLGPNHRHTRVMYSRLGGVYGHLKRFDKAAEVLAPLAEFERQRKPVDPPRLADALTHLGHSLLSSGQAAQAEPVLRESLAIREQIAKGQYATLNTRSVLGGALLAQEMYTEAEPLLLTSFDGMKQIHAKNPRFFKARFIEACERLVQLYEAWQKPEDAAKWRKELEVIKR